MMFDGIQKMKANPKVLEHNCLICNHGFSLMEDVYECSTCGGYHHIRCWDLTGECPRETTDSATEPPQTDVLGTDIQPRETEMLAPDRPSQERVEELKTVYSKGETEHLERALTTQRKRYEDVEISLMEAELRRRGVAPPMECTQCGLMNPGSADRCTDCGYDFQALTVVEDAQTTTLAGDELICPVCSGIIKRRALKCWHCGYVLDPQLRVQELGGFLSQEEKQRIEEEIKKKANSALTLSIVGIFCVGIILGPMAISRANKALDKIKQYPACAANSSARGKAIAAKIIGWIVVILFVIGILARIASAL